MFLTWKNVNPIINRKNYFLWKIHFFSWKNLRITLSMVNRLFFRKLDFWNIRKMQQKHVDFCLFQISYIIMVFLTSISTKKSKCEIFTSNLNSYIWWFWHYFQQKLFFSFIKISYIFGFRNYFQQTMDNEN